MADLPPEQSPHRAARPEESKCDLDYRDLFERAPVAYLVLDGAGGIVTVNERAAVLLGWPADWLAGRPLDRWIVTQDRELFSNHIASLRRANDGDTLCDELRIKTRSGRSLHVRLESLALASSSTRYRTAMIDVSAHRNAERRARAMQRRLAHDARVSALGEMAACLAHDLNQPLGTVLLNCEAAQRLLEAEPDARQAVADALSDATEAAAYAGSVVRNLRKFLRRDGIERVVSELGALIEAAIRLTDAEARDQDVHIVVDCPADLPVAVEPVHVEQVLVNLICNSIEAMSASDTVQRHIEIRAARFDAASIIVSVRDSGPGMSPAIAAHAFEPFFTSKEGGMGTGLSISRSIIDAHGGRIWLDARAASGAHVHFTLPVADR